eukprot:133871-Chlamydomonas_euryale.AAC.1
MSRSFTVGRAASACTPMSRSHRLGQARQFHPSMCRRLTFSRSACRPFRPLPPTPFPVLPPPFA